MNPGKNTLEHLPGCTAPSVVEIATERGVPLPADMPEGAQLVRIQKCVDGCPVLARTLARAREVAREQGWLDGDDNFNWEKPATTALEEALAGRVGELEDALFECAKWAGEDVSGGRPTWPDIAVWAVEAVKQARADYDDALDEIALNHRKDES